MNPEKAHERGRCRKMQPLGYLQYGHVGCLETAFGLDGHHLVQPLTNRMARHALDRIRKAFGG